VNGCENRVRNRVGPPGLLKQAERRQNERKLKTTHRHPSLRRLRFRYLADNDGHASHTLKIAERSDRDGNEKTMRGSTWGERFVRRNVVEKRFSGGNQRSRCCRKEGIKNRLLKTLTSGPKKKIDAILRKTCLKKEGVMRPTRSDQAYLAAADS